MGELAVRPLSDNNASDTTATPGPRDDISVASDSSHLTSTGVVNLPSLAANLDKDLQGAAPYGPARCLADSAVEKSSKQKDRLTQKELRQALKAAARAEKALEEAEKKRRLAEAHAARVQCSSYCSDSEVQRAREAQRAAEAAIRRNTLATFTALERSRKKEGNRLHNSTVLPPISGPVCVVCLDAAAEVMAYPCGHRCYCDVCAEGARSDFAATQLERGDRRLTRCPVCREVLDNLVRVF